ncbi:hypothetical protein PDTK01_30280 [Phycicoccus sp. DTK01]|nr:hypothetical protein PDTK01_30280 [Phycicoccus sp. DTK01]
MYLPSLHAERKVSLPPATTAIRPQGFPSAGNHFIAPGKGNLAGWKEDLAGWEGLLPRWQGNLPGWKGFLPRWQEAGRAPVGGPLSGSSASGWGPHLAGPGIRTVTASADRTASGSRLVTSADPARPAVLDWTGS